MAELDDWIASTKDALGLVDPVDTRLVLDLAREVAHAVERPAAPLTSYLLGVAVGRGADAHEAVEAVRAALREVDPPASR
ncbi:MAG: molybdopterin-guanine dinucleotide biosynthesis protein [Frankiales bacterium]|nr:molybdopterin-guanine dinucleotide biosynthesis protein [Frankiales bacterium]